MADNDKKKKPQTPGGGKPRKDTAPAKGPAAPAATGGQVNIYANDPESGGMQPLVPGPGYTDHRPKMYKGGSAQTFVNGHGLDMGLTENRNFVSEVNRHERAMFRRRANAEKEEFDRKTRQARDQRDRESQARRNQERLDRNFARGVFSIREGWENLGRSEGLDKDGKKVSYGRGAAGVENYDARYEKLRKRADILTKAFETGDYTGRGKEWAAIRKLVADTHANGGLTDKQLAGIEAKMESLRGGLNDRINYANKVNEYYAALDVARKRREIGDVDGLLSDDQVNAAFDRRKWDNVRGAVEKYGKSDPTTYAFNESGDRIDALKTRLDRIDALKTMLDNGISATRLAGIAVNSGEGDWKSRYDKLLSGGLSRGARTSGVEDIGVEFLRQQLARGDAGIKALNDAIAGANTVTGKTKAARTKEISWDDEPSSPPEKKPPTPQEARTAAENAEMFRQGATAEEVEQLGPTVKRANEEVQKAGNIAEAAASVGALPPALTPREKSFMKMIPGSHQSDGSMGEVTPMRAAGFADMQANLNESLVEAGIPLTPRKQATPAPEPNQPPPPVLHGGNTGEHAVQTVETGFDRAANKVARKVKSWFD